MSTPPLPTPAPSNFVVLQHWCHCNETCRQQLLSAFGDFLESLPSKAESKLLCVKAVCNLTGTLLSGSATRGQTAMSDPEAAREVRRWLQLLPELLCQWGGEFPESSAAALRALVEVAKLAPSPAAAVAGTPGASRGGGQARGKTAIAAGEAAAGGGGGGGGARAMESSELLRSIKPELLGEFLSGRGFPTLQAEAQMDAISLLYHLPSIPACVVTALAAACSEPNTLHGDVRSFALEVGCPVKTVPGSPLVWSALEYHNLFSQTLALTYASLVVPFYQYGCVVFVVAYRFFESFRGPSAAVGFPFPPGKARLPASRFPFLSVDSSYPLAQISARALVLSLR